MSTQSSKDTLQTSKKVSLLAELRKQVRALSPKDRKALLKDAFSPKELQFATKTAGKLSIEQIIGIANNSLDTLKERKALRTAITNECVNKHKEYEAPKAKPHLKARKRDSQIVMNSLLGWNKAYKLVKAAVLGHKSAIADFDPKDWIATERMDSFNKSQLDWAMKSIPNLKGFLSEKDRKAPALSPKMVINALSSAATMTAPTFSKRVQWVNEQRKQSKAKADKKS